MGGEREAAMIKLDARDTMLIREAVAIAIEAMERLPDLYRPCSDIHDLKDLLTRTISDREVARVQEQAKRRIDVDHRTSPPPPLTRAN